ncbi:alpha-amylase family glycosyl hydrolase [Pseudopedobacter beijingensis]|uniref:Alpha-amylase family glycosyl hydrolase n=1 Tax=Pseudopedobacter beijingensis TaxID=1207056 RepID=A0ABW4I8G0_9SPHI
MRFVKCFLVLFGVVIIWSCTTSHRHSVAKDEKIVLYQLMVRLFGNQNQTNKHYGSKEENGVGKFNDITSKALSELKNLGISHVWYTGIIEHATMTDYTNFNIKSDDPDVVKGRAGSPYAIKDYYDVAPDLAVQVNQRMEEFEALIQRTHQAGLKAIIDFVPNHVARTYQSDKKPAHVRDFGEDDDKKKNFTAKNDFYYLPGTSFAVPQQKRIDGFEGDKRDGFFEEKPAKATGNNVFTEKPSDDDWYETIKLNYGVDYQKNGETHFDPIPPVWEKMHDILVYWVGKGVNGFRCDMAEMVPVEFWNWVIPKVKEVNPEIIFIAEAYNPDVYENYLTIGCFDYLYDKVGLYDALKPLIKNEEEASVENIRLSLTKTKAYQSRFLSFLENHDEERIASQGFAGDPTLALPGMVVSATISGGPVMIYFGQEVGEPGKGNEGYGGEDGRSTIFDYWGVPEHQKWMNAGRFDGKALSAQQQDLRAFYSRLLNLVKAEPAIVKGTFTELTVISNSQEKTYAYLRSFGKEHVLVLANFNRGNPIDVKIKLPDYLLRNENKKLNIENILEGGFFEINSVQEGVSIKVQPSSAQLLKFEL